MANANLIVKIAADSSKLVKELNQVSSDLNSFGAKAKKLGGFVQVALGSAAVAGVAALTKSALDAGNQLENLTRIAGAGIEEFQRYAAGARALGVDQEKLSDIFKDTNDKVADFLVTGGGPLKDFFETVAPLVGVTADQFRNLSGPQSMGLYVESLKKANLSQAEMTFFMEAIASDSTALIPLFEKNSQLLSAQAGQAERFNSILTKMEVKNLKDASIAMGNLGDNVTGLSQKFIASLAPAISEATNNLTEFLATMISGESSVAALEAKLAELESKRFTNRNAKLGERYNAKRVKELKEEISIRKALTGDESELATQREKHENRLTGLREQLNSLARGDRVERASVNEKIKEQIALVERLNEVSQPKEDSVAGVGAANQAGSLLAGLPTESDDPDKAEAKLERITMQLMSEEELITNSFLKRQDFLNEHLSKNKDFEGKFHDLSLKSLDKFNKQKSALEKKNRKHAWTEEEQQRRNTLGATAQFFGVMASNSKSFGVAQALINTYLGVSESLAAYPMPLAAIMASTHLAAGMQQVNAIRSGGGGGSIPSVSASQIENTIPDITPVSDQEAARREEEDSEAVDIEQTKTVRIVIDGEAELIPRETLRGIVEQINEINESNVRISY